VGPDDPVSEADAARLRELREALRRLVIANHSGGRDAEAAAVVARAAARARLAFAVDDAGETTLEPAGRGADGAVAKLLAILHEAQLKGQWPRMKACRQCEYAFFDRSKNQSAAWCAMSICGNRNKNRAYYRRRSTAG
jgi:predicted RNA-binding Zn ribbon-like protein